MTANGFDQFLEQSDYENPVFTNAWGVSDEDLFRRALIEFDRLHEMGRPFFSVVLTVSNHRPYTYPPGRIPEAGQSRDHAVKYADWALGQFFRAARSRAFYSQTIFVVMGDHGARVYGSQMFPMKSYRVPMLVIHPEAGFAGRRCHTLGSSIDVAPTIMGLLGGAYRSVFFGRDVTQLAPHEGLAVMQHNHEVALLTANHELTVLSVGKKAWNFRLDPSTYLLDPVSYPGAAALIQVTSYFQTAYRLYTEERCFPGETVRGANARFSR
jgi:phosphoglycerol transferase MdoB-like AlkP superfamily enzyme